MKIRMKEIKRKIYFAENNDFKIEKHAKNNVFF